jgi:hypothetical protein
MIVEFSCFSAGARKKIMISFYYMKKRLIKLGIIILCLGLILVSSLYLSHDTYVIISKDVGMIITRESIREEEAGRAGEGLITIRTLYRASKDIRLTVICSKYNYLAFVDLCNNDYLLENRTTRLDYLLGDKSADSRDVTFQFSIGHFDGKVVGDKPNETIDNLLEKSISIPGGAQ